MSEQQSQQIIDLDTLQACIASAAPKQSLGQAHDWAIALDPWLKRFSIDNVDRVAMFAGQVSVESASFTAMSEDLLYSASGLLRTWPSRFTPTTAVRCERQPERIANIVYADRMGNGNEASGDGWRFRGAGLIQLTGRETYTLFGKSFGSTPDAAAEYARTRDGACRSACWYWDSHGLNAVADRWDIEAVTLAINGGVNGLGARSTACNDARKAACRLVV